MAFALWAVQAGGAPAAFDRITPELAAKRAAECGLAAVSLSYDDLLQSNVLTLADAATATDGQLACIEMAASYHHVKLPPHLEPRFDAIREARWSAVSLTAHREWLAERGLLDKVPRFVPGVTDKAAFAREVEKLCGPRAAGALQSRFGDHVISTDWLLNLPMSFKPKDLEPFSCLLAVAAVAGLKVGLIGNEATAAPP